MAKLVVLTAGLTDRSIELQTERTTIGRVEDNTFQIAVWLSDGGVLGQWGVLDDEGGGGAGMGG